MIFHLLIADDEATTLKGLINYMPWRDLDCVVDASASDGKTAIQLIESNPPDIVITDIKMPGASGIDVAEYVQQYHPQIRVIILSGYAEFNYACSAMHYGAADYILKPISKEALSESIRKVQAEILGRQNDQNLLQENISCLREQFFQELADRRNDPAKLSAKGKLYGITLNSYRIIAFKATGQKIHGKKIEFVYDILTKRHPDDYVFHHGEFMLWICKIADEQSKSLTCIFESCREVIDMGASLYGLPVLTGISSIKHGFFDFEEAEAIDALNQSFYTGQSISCFRRQEPAATQDYMGEYLEYLVKVEQLWSECSYDEGQKWIADLFTRLKANLASTFDTKSLSIQIYYICLQSLIKNNLSFPNSDFFIKLNLCENITEIQELVISCCMGAVELLNFHGKIKNRMVEKAIRYINSHYEEELSLSLIAKNIHVNPSHLSRTFKKECGDSVTDYIMKIRIEKAQEILSFSNTLTYEVAEMVGFHDPSYFSTVFKKMTGVSPKEFKKLN